MLIDWFIKWTFPCYPPDFCNNDVAFQCGDTSCLSKRLVCDGHVDCVDGADERNCSQIYKTCDDIYRDGLTKDGIYTIGWFLVKTL
jgi:hypothetical protein